MTVFETQSIQSEQETDLSLPVWRILRVGAGMVMGMALCLALAVTLPL